MFIHPYICIHVPRACKYAHTLTHTPGRERPLGQQCGLLFRNRINQINTVFFPGRKGWPALFLFLFLLGYLPPTFLKESRKDTFNSCVLVGSCVYFKLGGILKKIL